MDRLTEIEVFIRAVDTGSFSAAARQLQLGQPAISKTIARLEERLEVKLMLRSAHGLVLTEAGQMFYEHAKRALDEADEAYRVAGKNTSDLSGELEV
jgi:DNA-binding transcriptional LysR family regulator